MVGVVKHAKGLETRSGRMKLKPGRQPYWRSIVLGRVALGYQRQESGKPGRWITRSYVSPGKYAVRPLGAADDYGQADGAAILSYEDALLVARQSQDVARGHMTVADALADYIAWLRTHRATGRDAEQRARKLILPVLGKIRLSDLTARHLTKWRDALAAQPALVRSRDGAPQKFRPAPSTPDGIRARRASTNRTWTILRAALNKAFHDGHVASDVAWRRVKPFPQTDAARPGFLTAAEAARLVNASDPDFRLLVRGALESGARFSELAAARVREYQGDKLYIARPKTGRPRNVTLSDNGIGFFDSITIGRAPDAHIFLRDGRPWQRSEQARPMKLAREAARISAPITFHGLRHTWASLAVMAGMPLMVVARNLGHRDTRMVEKYYGHLREDFVDKAVRDYAPDYGLEPEPRNVAPLRKQR